VGFYSTPKGYDALFPERGHQPAYRFVGAEYGEVLRHGRQRGPVS